MEFARVQYQLIGPLLNGMLYTAEQGCEWRPLTERLGRWHTIYMRAGRFAKSGVSDRVCSIGRLFR